MENGKIAIPSNGEGGLDGTRAGHFGHCDVFTLIDVENGEIKEVSILQNQEHAQGGYEIAPACRGRRTQHL